MMNKDDEIFCWMYNLFDKDRFNSIVEREGIDLSVDFSSEESVMKLVDTITKRIAALDAGKINVPFQDDVIGYNVLRLAASMSTRGKSWYLQKEVEIFKNRVGGLKDGEIISIVNDMLFKGKIVMERAMDRELKAFYQKVEDNAMAVKVKWNVFSGLIREREHTVHGGWIFTTMRDMMFDIASIFKDALLSSLNETYKRIEGTEMETILEPCVDLIDAMVDEVNVPANTSMDDILQISPLCMRILDKEMASGVNIGYTSYLILAFFLKSYKEHDELVNYFYSRNPQNNKYATVEEFLKDQEGLSYTFKQMYGQKGGGTSYKSYKCSSIKAEGVCPFASMMGKQDETTDRMKSLMDRFNGTVMGKLDDGTRSMIANVLAKIVQSGNTARACGFEFETRFEIEKVLSRQRGKRRYVSHPVKAYFEEAIKARDGGKENKDDGH